MLPASVADQIRRAQVKQALLGQGNAAWAVGAACLALYSGDGQYYPATVKAVTDAGNFVVLFEGYGNEEEVRGVMMRSPVCWQWLYGRLCLASSSVGSQGATRSG